MPSWIYERSTNRYRVTREGAELLGLRPGTFIGENRRIELRDEWTEAQKLITDRLALDYDRGDIRLSDWVLQMRQEVKTSYIEQYLLGIGGRNNMTPSDWGRLGNALRNQYGYLQGFADDLMNRQPPLTLAQIKARMRQYINGSTAMYERARAKAQGAPALPEYPADGSQDCRSNCKCHWRIEETETEWRAFWELEGGADHCDSCLSNNAKWYPLVILK